MQGNDDIERKVNSNRFGQIAIVIMVIVFITNFFASDCDLFWIFLSGGSSIVDYTSVSYSSVFREFQLFRLVTYGYTQTAVWHLVVNLYGLWYVSLYLEKKIGTQVFMGSTQLVTCEDTSEIKDSFWKKYDMNYDEFCNTYRIEKIQTVILVHGLGGNRYTNYPLTQMFLQKGYNVLTYNQRSSNENTAQYTTFGYWITDIIYGILWQYYQ